MCKQLREKKVDICCVQEQNEKSKELDLLISRVGNTKCGYVEIMME